MTLLLTFNPQAIKALAGQTRLRVLPKSRGGVSYVAIRPSFRVAGRNAMLRTVTAEDGTVTAELPASLFTELNLPPLPEDATYLMHDIGYGWFTLKPVPDDEADPAIVTVTKGVAKAAEDAAEDAADEGETTTSTETADVKEVEVKLAPTVEVTTETVTVNTAEA